MLSNFGRISMQKNCFSQGCDFFFSFPKEFKVYFLEVSAMEGFSDFTDSSDIVQHFEE